MTIINSINKGKQPVIDTLNVTPSTTAQTITATGGTDGYSPVNVSAVTSSIDANIVAGNIKDGVSILGVTGNYSGIQPTGTKSITANGVYDVTNYASADVQVPTTAPAHYIEKSVDANGMLIGGSTIMDFTGVKSIGNNQLYNAYYNNTSISGAVDMSDLITVNTTNAAQGAFFQCTGITSVDLSSLTTISGQYAFYQAFQNCTGITNVDLSSLTTISGAQGCQNMFNGSGITGVLDLSSLMYAYASNACYYMFKNCTGITSVDLSGLTTLSGSQACGYMFQGCTGITSVDLSSLTLIYSYSGLSNFCSNNTLLTNVDLSSLTTVSSGSIFYQAFANCTSLTTISFPSLNTNSFGSSTNQFSNMLQDVTGCTVHFPSNLQSVIGSWADVTAGFGGTNTTVLFDLPATNTLTGVDTVTYTRNPKYDTATALAWKVGAYGTTNFTPAYYTSGLTDPTVGTTIYSDAACTVSVTTVDTVA